MSRKRLNLNQPLVQLSVVGLLILAGSYLIYHFFGAKFVTEKTKIERKGMREIDHNNLEYAGAPGEKVTIRITAHGTTQMVNYTLDGGAPKPLKSGDPIEFNLKNAAGQRTDLQLILDFNAQGSYEVVVENVSNCSKAVQHAGTCVHTWEGPPREIETFAFFTE